MHPKQLDCGADIIWASVEEHDGVCIIHKIT